MSYSPLNLTRSWRSRTFEEIIGQSLIVRILKNSLYKNLFFPVYLFAGSRGCGKTTLARIFGASVNCAQLSKFQQKPDSKIPCHACDSCIIFFEGKHPDFIEIDGASHTSVDNVRSIIEASSFLPVMGRKKIYLIDEAHMLSKSAFNAFLKILEEPPHSVLFILATTDAHKILDTVISRCFQLYFKPVESPTIVEHLKTICLKENITYEQNGLQLIADQSEGSVRDAINLLERVRLASSTISQQDTLDALGFIDDNELLICLQYIIAGNTSELISLLARLDFRRFNIIIIWKKWIQLLTAAVWLKTGYIDKVSLYYRAGLQALLNTVSLEQLNNYRIVCYHYELQFAKTAAPYELLETIFITLCTSSLKINRTLESDSKTQKPLSAISTNKITSQEEINNTSPLWNKLLERISTLQDPLINSVLRQARYRAFNQEKSEVVISFPKNMSFFAMWLADSKSVWQAIINDVYQAEITLQVNFEDEIIKTSNTIIKQDSGSERISTSSGESVINNQTKSHSGFREYNNQKNKFTSTIQTIDIKKLSPRVQEIISVFPGQVSLMKEHDYE